MISVIIGKQGQGKTTLIKSRIKSSLQNILIFDLTGEYQFLSKKKFKIITKWVDYKSELKKKFFKIVFNLQTPENICYMIPAILNRKDMEIYFDEAHLLVKEKSVSKLIRYSRQRKIDLYFVSHRIYDLPVILRAMLERLILFNMQSPEDIDYLKKFLNQDHAEIIRSLKRFSYLDINISESTAEKKTLTINFK